MRYLSAVQVRTLSFTVDGSEALLRIPAANDLIDCPMPDATALAGMERAFMSLCRPSFLLDFLSAVESFSATGMEGGLPAEAAAALSLTTPGGAGISLARDRVSVVAVVVVVVVAVFVAGARVSDLKNEFNFFGWFSLSPSSWVGC